MLITRKAAVTGKKGEVLTYCATPLTKAGLSHRKAHMLTTPSSIPGDIINYMEQIIFKAHFNYVYICEYVHV